VTDLRHQIKEAVDNAAMVVRLSRDLPGWLRTPTTLEAAQARIRAGLATREEQFLALAKRGIYRHRRSPYRALLAHAGCELGDVRRLVASEGLEGALTSLAAQGVYVTVDEMKGRQPIVRGSFRLQARSSDFDNPIAPLHLLSYTGGSGGRPSRVRRSLALFDELADLDLVFADIHGHTGATPVLWVTNTVARILRLIRTGVTTMHWLYPVKPLSWQVRALALHIALLAKLAGRPFPSPEYMGIDEADAFATRLARCVAETGSVLCVTTPSSAVRSAVAATAAGHSLAGVTFILRGEAVTAARRRDIESAGAYVFSIYGAEEAGNIAASCAAPVEPDDSHVMSHRFAVTGRDRPIWEGGPLVRALQVTSLTAAAPKILLNADMGDCGDVEVQGPECCGLGALGLTTHLSNVRSFEKLTGEGMTVVGAHFLHLIEEMMPARFGGSSVDYQLVEQENAEALTELVLRVHPRVGPVDDTALRDTLLAELERGDVVDRHVAHVWRRLQTIRISREPPLATPTGKIYPFRIARGAASSPTGA
jgi:hypothetical protein